jgi:hypothetical protein
MMRTVRYTVAMLAAAALVSACSDSDALTSPPRTTVATVHPAEPPASRSARLFDGPPLVGSGQPMSRVGARLEWVDESGASVVVGGLSGWRPRSTAADAPRGRSAAAE